MLINAKDGIPIVADMQVPADGPAPAESVPLVLLHGLSQQRHYWKPVMRHLSHRILITVDQRGHGEGATDEVDAQSDFSMDRLADDVMDVLAAYELESAIVVGHSWGASVALHTAARHPHAVRSAVLLDGGLFGPRHLVSDDRSLGDVREALRPPPLGLLEPALWQAISGGDLSPYWSAAIREALTPTFSIDEAGRAFTRLGMDRHMAVLEGLIDYDPTPDVALVKCPTWVVSCEQRAGEDNDDLTAAWARAREQALVDLPRTFFVQRWVGALHDVPLQWPAMVAGLLETVAERIEPPREGVQ